MNEAKTDASQLPINQVLCGNCVEVMKTLPDEAIDLAMFSPPYYGLRDYGISGQIGLEDHPSKYIEKVVDVCREVKRLLKKAGSMYIVLGDTYYGSGKGYGSDTPCKNLPEPECHPRLSQNNRTNWLQPKQLLGIPWRVAIALQEDGWILRNCIIWNKPNHMPSSVKDRLTNAYEHIFHFVKNRKYYYDLGAIREPHKEGVTRWGGNIMRPAKNPKNQQGLSAALVSETRLWRNPLGKNPSDVILTKHDIAVRRCPTVNRIGGIGYTDPLHVKAYNKEGKNPADVLKLDSVACPSGPQRWEREGTNHVEARFHPDGKNPSDFWNITTKPFKGAHFAVYPEDVCIKPILSSCPQWICRKCGKPRTRITKVVNRFTQQWGERRTKPWFQDKREMPQKIISESVLEHIGSTDCGCGAGFDSGIVLDPMCGSGTTLVVAKKFGRKYIGIELNPSYIEIALKRLAAIPEKITTFF